MHAWLSLTEAARRLGVHPVTLRHWADAGAIPVMRTVGGHRRFSETAIASQIAGQTAPQLIEHGLVVTRQRLIQAPAAVTIAAEDALEQHRADCRALLGLVMQYVTHPEDSLLDEARRFGGRLAASARHANLSLAEAVGAALFFRDTLIDSILDTPGDSARPVARVNQILNTVQIAIIEQYG